MAVRFTAESQTYTGPLSLGTASFSVTTWAKLSVDRNAYSTFWCVDNNVVPDVTQNLRILQTDVDGTTANLYPLAAGSPGVTSVGSMTVGTWYFIGIAVNTTANTAIAKIRAAGAGSFTTVSNLGPNYTLASSITNLRLGQSIYGTGEWLNGCLAGVKIWSAELTATELEAEYPYADPLRTSNVHASYRFDSASTVDNSGNGRTLSGGVSATTETGPTFLPLPAQFSGWGVPIL